MDLLLQYWLHHYPPYLYGFYVLDTFQIGANRISDCMMWVCVLHARQEMRKINIVFTIVSLPLGSFIRRNSLSSSYSQSSWCCPPRTLATTPQLSEKLSDVGLCDCCLTVYQSSHQTAKPGVFIIIYPKKINLLSWHFKLKIYPETFMRLIKR